MDQRKGVLVLVLIALLAQVCNSQDNENKSKTDDKKPKKYSKLDKIKPTKEEVIEKVKRLKTKDKVNDEETSTVKDMSTTAQVAQKKEITNPRDRLSQKLLSNYNKNIHPVKNWKQSVKVDVGMALIHLDLDERHSVVNIDSWMRFNWTDEYLVWDPQDYDGLDQIHFRGQDIWTPDIHLYNNADGANMNHFGDVLYLVYNDGKVLWVPPAKMQAFCKIDLRMWPHESPRCRLKFGSWTSHGDQISLGLFNGKDEVEYLNFYTDNKEWIIVNTTVRLNTNKYPSVEETYPDVTFTFNLKRNSPSYRAGVILPCLITMLLVVTSFLLPPHAGDKLLVNTVSLISKLHFNTFQSRKQPYNHQCLSVCNQNMQTSSKINQFNFTTTFTNSLTSTSTTITILTNILRTIFATMISIFDLATFKLSTCYYLKASLLKLDSFSFSLYSVFTPFSTNSSCHVRSYSSHCIILQVNISNLCLLR